MALESEFVQRHMRRLTTGLAVKGLNISAARVLPIPVPADAAEESRMVRAWTRLSDSSIQLAEHKRAVGNLRTSLLNEVFGGAS